MILADYGAEVIKVEPPEGDPFRRLPGFLQWNRGKRSVVLDLKTDAGRRTAQTLARDSDLVIENFRPGVADRLGIGYEELSRIKPDLIYLSISGFGQKGKYRSYKGYEGIVSAKCGQHVIQCGYRGDEPHYDAVFKGSFGAAIQGLIGVLAALHLKEKTGVGQRVEATMVQAIYVYSYGGIRFETPELYRRYGGIPGRDPRNNSSVGFRIAECADGKTIQSGSASGRIFENMMRALGIDEYFIDPRFKNGVISSISEEDKAYLISLIDAAYKAKPLQEWIRIFDEQDVGYALFATTQEFMDHPQVRHNDHVIEVDDPTVGRMEQVGRLVRFVGEEWPLPGPAPLLGQHTQEVLAGLAGAAPEPASAEAFPPVNMPEGALNGVTVIDLSTYAAAPGGPGILADLGARVIKVEPPEGEPMSSSLGDLFFKLHRGKERICLDLKSAEGREILNQLVAGADIFLHNFRPGVPERLGLDYEALRKVNPRLVYLYASAFGSSGPDAQRPAFDPVVSAMAGAEALQAGEGNPPQDKRVSDHTAYMGVAVAMLLGLRAREVSGESQQLETTMLASAAHLFSDDFLRYEGKPARPLPDKGQYGLGPLYRLYRAGEGWVFLAVLRDREWSAFCEAVGHPEWRADPRFSTDDERMAHKGELVGLLEPLFRERTAQEWEELLQARDVACAVASGRWPDFLFDDWDGGQPQSIVEYSYPGIGQMRHSGMKVSLLKTPGKIGPPQILGESTRAVLAELGYSSDQIDDLKARNLVAWRER
jgi:crotonobetainyl-CoA:carnitine CoA-transferase CaiB-like acyl-CoA transferase